MELDVSKLKEGKIVKNYKEMCELLEQKEKSGRSRKYQIENWKRYFSWHNEGHKFIIDKINSNPAYKIDLRSDGNHTKYANEIADILVYWLSNNTHTNNYNFSLGKLIEITCMANQSFQIGSKFREATSIILNLGKDEIEVFFSDMRGEFKAIIERALKILQNRCVILVKNSITVYDKELKRHRLATNDEEELILDWEKETLRKLGLRDKQEMFLKRKLYEFNKRMMSYLSSIDCRYYYHSYNLTIGQNALAIEKGIIEEQKKRLNEKCVERAERKFNYSDEAIKLISLFIDTNTDWLKLTSEITSKQEEIQEEKKQRRKKAKNLDELMEIIFAEEGEKEKQYQYDINGSAKKNIYNQLSNDEKLFRGLGLL